MLALKEIEDIKSMLKAAYKYLIFYGTQVPSREQIIACARSRFGTNLVSHNKLTNTIFKDQEVVTIMNLVLDDIVGTNDPTNDLLKIRALLSTATGFIHRNNTVLSDLDNLQIKAKTKLDDENAVQSPT